MIIKIKKSTPIRRHESVAIGCIIVLAILALTTVAWVIPSYFEARAFESVTGKSVSTWDAMWIELRVQEQSR